MAAIFDLINFVHCMSPLSTIGFHHDLTWLNILLKVSPWAVPRDKSMVENVLIIYFFDWLEHAQQCQEVPLEHVGELGLHCWDGGVDWRAAGTVVVVVAVVHVCQHVVGHAFITWRRGVRQWEDDSWLKTTCTYTVGHVVNFTKTLQKPVIN